MKIAFVHASNYPSIPRGAGYVIGAILQAGHNLKFYDTSLIRREMIVKNVIEENYDLLMISTSTLFFLEALEIIRDIKKNRDIPNIIGGIHPTIMGSGLLEDHKEIDYLCIGEGESFILDFLINFGRDSLYDVKNLAYRRNGKVYANPLRPAEDLSKLPQFPWQLFPKEAITDIAGFAYVNASRGCPYNCTYCSNVTYLSYYGKEYLRFKPIPDVITELKYLREAYRPRLFYFVDEMIFTRPHYAAELFHSIKNTLDVPYGCMGRVEYINQEIVATLRDTGCRYIAIGIECGNEDFRRRYLNRNMTNYQIENTFCLINKAGMFSTAFNMIGFPFDNDDFLTDETIKLNKRIRPNYSEFSIFYPFPGTKLYQRCIESNLIDETKMAGAKNYFTDSILKGVSLRAKREKIDAFLNPLGWYFVDDPRTNLFYILKRNNLIFYIFYIINRLYKKILKIDKALGFMRGVLRRSRALLKRSRAVRIIAP